MAPAYEFWPNLESGAKLVICNKEVVAKHTSPQHVGDHQRNSSSRNLLVSRNLLPKPVLLYAGEDSRPLRHGGSVSRSITSANLVGASSSAVRMKTKLGQSDNDARENELELEDEAKDVDGGDQETGTDQANSPDTTNEEDPANESDAMRPTATNEEAAPKTNSSDGLRINFKVFDSKQALASAAENRRSRLHVSPIYPPGDLDRLYSDALLVYIKDFNQYIKR